VGMRAKCQKRIGQTDDRLKNLCSGEGVSRLPLTCKESQGTGPEERPSDRCTKGEPVKEQKETSLLRKKGQFLDLIKKVKQEIKNRRMQP